MFADVDGTILQLLHDQLVSSTSINVLILAYFHGDYDREDTK